MKRALLYSPRNSAISLYVLAVIIVVAVVWAYLTPIDISVRARGIVRPEGEPVRTISEVGGRIHQVHVKEGDHVHAGDALLPYAVVCFFSIRAHASLSVTVRLNTGEPGRESGSAQK